MPSIISSVTVEEASGVLHTEYKRLQRLFTVDAVRLRKITNHFTHELEVGLSKDGGGIPMNPTWVTKLPTGTEKGRYLTIDMGGTNLRVCQVKLHGSAGKFDVVQMESKITQELKNGTAEQLWHHVADSLQKFVDREGISREELASIPLAFTFSYPVTQTSVSDGVLQTWTKGFNISGVEGGEEIVSQLQKVLDEKDLPIRIVALVNDTVGTLMASQYMDTETEIGSLFGTGSNAAYMKKYDALMAINCEYGGFDNSARVLPFTQYEMQIDKGSPRPGQQRYEKMVTGLYLGQPYTLDSSFLSRLETDTSQNLHMSKKMFEESLFLTPTHGELQFCQQVAHLIASRAGRLYACEIAAIMKKWSFERCHVAVDGSVFNKYPNFPERVLSTLGEIFQWPGGLSDSVKIIPAVDGSSVGAAVIAALAAR
ncbi:hexokinase-domain-containing protein [Aspergillus crustosus]